MNTLYQNDPLLGNLRNEQLRTVEDYRKKITQQVNQQNSISKSPLWDEIDSSMAALSSEHKSKLMENEEYIQLSQQLSDMVQSAMVAALKPTIEGSDAGKELLQKIKKVIDSQKEVIEREQNEELVIFRKWKEFSKKNPKATYNEFTKTL